MIVQLTELGKVVTAFDDVAYFEDGSILRLGDDVVLPNRKLAFIQCMGMQVLHDYQVEVWINAMGYDGSVNVFGFYHNQKCYWPFYLQFILSIGWPWPTARASPPPPFTIPPPDVINE